MERLNHSPKFAQIAVAEVELLPGICSRGHGLSHALLV
jgi:hypothetical protein